MSGLSSRPIYTTQRRGERAIAISVPKIIYNGRPNALDMQALLLELKVVQSVHDFKGKEVNDSNNVKF